MPLIDFFRPYTFDPSSTLGAENFLRPLADPANYTVLTNTSGQWTVQLTSPVQGVSRITFQPATAFTPGASSSPPLGAVGSITLQSASGGTLQAFTSLGSLNLTVAQLLTDPALLVSGVDDFLGSTGADILYSGAGDDLLDGDAGNDRLFGQTGDDLIVGWTGDDTVSGGDGDDQLAGGLGNDTVDGGEGIDLASYFDAASAVTVSLAITGAQITGGAGADTLIGIEALEGSAFNDTLTGDASSNLLVGGAGNDNLDGAVGADLLIGGLGNDTYHLDEAGDAAIEAVGEGGDTIVAAFDFTLIDNFEWLELVGSAIAGFGNAVDNTITGNELDNHLEGLAGSDTLNGLGGDDFLDGGDHNDTLMEAMATTRCLAATTAISCGQVRASISSTAAQNSTYWTIPRARPPLKSSTSILPRE